MKTGLWSNLEDDYLFKLVDNCRILDKEYKEFIVRQINRKTDNVARRLKAMVVERRSTDPASRSEEFLDSNLGANGQTVFEKRMRQIIERLLKEDITVQ